MVYLNFFEGENVLGDKSQLYTIEDPLIPETIILDNQQNCFKIKNILENIKNNKIQKNKYIIKIGGKFHKGKYPILNKSGIFFLNKNTLEYFIEKINSCENFKLNSDFTFEKEKIILQAYIDDPLLYENKKIDFRVYLIIYSLQPLKMEIRNGFAKIANKKYNPKSFNVIFNI